MSPFKSTLLKGQTRRNRRVSLMSKACDALYHNNSLNEQLELPFGSRAYIDSLFIYMPTDTHQVNQQGNLLSHGYCYCKGGCE